MVTKDYYPGRPDLLSTLWERVRTKVKVQGTCWIWQGSCSVAGCPRLMVGTREAGTRKQVMAARISYALHYGEVPDGVRLINTCANKLCINPQHLYPARRNCNMRIK